MTKKKREEKKVRLPSESSLDVIYAYTGALTHQTENPNNFS